MKDLRTAARENCGTAFELAIKNCIRRVPASKQKKVEISKEDSEELYRFYLKYVENDRERALGQIALSSRRAASNGLTMSVIVFTLMLSLIFTFIFKSFWAPLGAVLLCAAVFYPLWKRSRTAQKIWAGRKALKGGTADALEKMCLVLAANPLRIVKWPVMGGILAALGVCVYQLTAALIK